MENRENDSFALFEALQAKGWHLEDNCLYSPNGGAIRMEGNAYVPRHMIERTYERTKEMLDKMQLSPPWHLDATQYKNHLQDLESMVTVLKEFLDRQLDIK